MFDACVCRLAYILVPRRYCRLTEIKGSFQRLLRMGLVPGIVAILVTSGVEVGILTQLGVFKTAVGLWVLVPQPLVTSAILLLLAVVGSSVRPGFESSRGA